MAVLINEQIKADEVVLTGLAGEKLGVVSKSEALAMARSKGVDLVCTSLMSSPPPCSLVAKGKEKRLRKKKPQQAKRMSAEPQKTVAKKRSRSFASLLILRSMITTRSCVRQTNICVPANRCSWSLKRLVQRSTFRQSCTRAATSRSEGSRSEGYWNPDGRQGLTSEIKPSLNGKSVNWTSHLDRRK